MSHEVYYLFDKNDPDEQCQKIKKNKDKAKFETDANKIMATINAGDTFRGAGTGKFIKIEIDRAE